MPSASTTSRGRAAEALVAAWLEARGWVVLARNLRVGRDEVDLLALDGAVLVCVEVRARRRGAMVSALATVTPAKQRRLRRAALRLAADRDARELRVDVAAVTDGEVELIEGAVDFSET
ncbi:MAG: YraN family protein [Polyangiales bacterium]